MDELRPLRGPVPTCEHCGVRTRNLYEPYEHEQDRYPDVVIACSKACYLSACEKIRAQQLGYETVEQALIWDMAIELSRLRERVTELEKRLDFPEDR